MLIAILLCGVGFYFTQFSSKRVTNNLPSFIDSTHTIQFDYPTVSGFTTVNSSDNSKVQYFEARYAITSTRHAWYMIEQSVFLPNPLISWIDYKKQQEKIIQEDNTVIANSTHEIILGGAKALAFDKKPNIKVIQTIHSGKQYTIHFVTFDNADDTDRSIASAYATFVSTFRFLK